MVEYHLGGRLGRGMWSSVVGWNFGTVPRVGFEMTCQSVFKRSPIAKGRFLFCYQNVRARRRRVGVACARPPRPRPIATAILPRRCHE